MRLACRLAERSDLLLLDEPTNHLDTSGIDFLTGEIVAWGGGIVMVTHDRQLLDDVATEILDLDPAMDGKPVLYGQPGYLAYRFAKNQALHRWRQRYRAERKRAERLAERLDDVLRGALRRVATRQGEPEAPSCDARAHPRQGRGPARAEARGRGRRGARAPAASCASPTCWPCRPGGPPTCRCSRCAARASDAGPRERQSEPGGRPAATPTAAAPAGARLDLPGTRIAIPPSGRLLITGPNGSGKSTLLAALAGTVRLDRGTRSVAEGVRVGIVAQEGPALPPGAEERTGFEEYAQEALDLLSAGTLDPDHLVPVAFLGLLTEEDLDRPLARAVRGAASALRPGPRAARGAARPAARRADQPPLDRPGRRAAPRRCASRLRPWSSRRTTAGCARTSRTGRSWT